MPAPHPPEFRQRAVELARADHTPVAKLAKDLQISESCLRNWMAQADADENGSATRLTTAEKKELAELRREKRRLLVAGQAATWLFVFGAEPPPGSVACPGRLLLARCQGTGLPDSR